MAKDFGGGISNSARTRMTDAILDVRRVVTAMEKTIKKEHLAAAKVKKARREESKPVRAEITRVNRLITKRKGVFRDAVTSFTKTVNNLKGDVTALAGLYTKLPKKAQ
ncbi:MAG TPA: hypothetical protein VN654_18285 [Vicinamibacterales bacterium]|jgi:hypothetical protein|nr:hypothetical protein [Vicinamibacterales bacterium]